MGLHASLQSRRLSLHLQSLRREHELGGRLSVLGTRSPNDNLAIVNVGLTRGCLSCVDVCHAWWQDHGLLWANLLWLLVGLQLFAWFSLDVRWHASSRHHVGCSGLQRRTSSHLMSDHVSLSWRCTCLRHDATTGQSVSRGLRQACFSTR